MSDISKGKGLKEGIESVFGGLFLRHPHDVGRAVQNGLSKPEAGRQAVGWDDMEEEDDLRIEAFGHMNGPNRRLIGCEVDGEEDFFIGLSTFGNILMRLRARGSIRIVYRWPSLLSSWAISLERGLSS